jgi:hypothetical protein
MILSNKIAIPNLCPLWFKEEQTDIYFVEQKSYIQNFYHEDIISIPVRFNRGEFASLKARVRNVYNDLVYEVTFSLYDINLDMSFGYCSISMFEKLGCFYVEILSNETILAKSHLFNVINTKQGTVLFSYYNTENDFDTIFNLNGEQFIYHLRVEGGFRPDEQTPKLKTEDMEDQFINSVPLYGMPYLIKRLTIGANYGIPLWMLFKVNSIFALDNIFIDNIGHTRSTSTEIEISEREGFNIGFQVGKIDLRETEHLFMENQLKYKRVFNRIFNKTFS